MVQDKFVNAIFQKNHNQLLPDGIVSTAQLSSVDPIPLPNIETSLPSTKRHLSVTSQSKLYAQTKVADEVRSWGKINRIARSANVSANYPRRLVKKIDSGGKFLRKNGSGRPTKMTSEKQQQLLHLLHSQNYDVTYSQMSQKIGLGKATLHRFMKKEGFRRAGKFSQANFNREAKGS